MVEVRVPNGNGCIFIGDHSQNPEEEECIIGFGAILERVDEKKYKFVSYDTSYKECNIGDKLYDAAKNKPGKYEKIKLKAREDAQKRAKKRAKLLKEQFCASFGTNTNTGGSIGIQKVGVHKKKRSRKVRTKKKTTKSKKNTEK